MSIIPFSGTVARLHDYGSELDGTRLVEVGWSFVGRGRSSPGVRGKGRDPEGNKLRALRRAKAQVRRLVMAGGFDHLLTLTWRENMTDEAEADRAFCRFVRLVRSFLPGWRYVAVKENQERGAWHWHVAVKGFQDVVLLRRLWREVVGEGNIDVQYHRKGPCWKRAALARYLAKYISKVMDVAFGRHRYRAAHGITVPTVVRRFANQWAVEDVLRWALEFAGQITYVFQDEGCGWACSW